MSERTSSTWIWVGTWVLGGALAVAAAWWAFAPAPMGEPPAGPAGAPAGPESSSPSPRATGPADDPHPSHSSEETHSGPPSSSRPTGRTEGGTASDSGAGASSSGTGSGPGSGPGLGNGSGANSVPPTKRISLPDAVRDDVLRRTSRSTEGLVEETLPNGSKKVDLQGRFQVVPVARFDENGELIVEEY
ncbi:MAG: hypothetical protein ACFB9M_13750 [Myxococcota bacterium]